MVIFGPFYQGWLKVIKEQGNKSTYWYSPASLFLASSILGRPGSASFHRSKTRSNCSAASKPTFRYCSLNLTFNDTEIYHPLRWDEAKSAP